MSRRLAPALAAIALAAGGVPPSLGAAGRSACELLAREEVGRVAGGSVAIDPSASGPDDRGGDNCVWTRSGRVAAEMRVERLASPQRAAQAFAASRVEAFGNGPAPGPVPGLGDEALYRDFERVKGGALIVRRGPAVVTLSGTLPKDGFVSLARLVLGRL